MKDTPSVSRWFALAVVMATGGFALTASAQQNGVRQPAPADLTIRHVDVAAPPLGGPPLKPVIKSPDGKTSPLTYHTSTANTRPELANVMAAAPAGPPAEGQVLGSQGVHQAPNVIPPFGTKGEMPGIAYRTGFFTPPAGVKLQPELAQLAQQRALAAGALAVKSAGAQSSACVYGMIVLNTRLDAGLRARLQALGVEIYGFYPTSAYQARIPSAALNSVAAMPEVLWVGQPSSTQKLAPELKQALAGVSLMSAKPYQVFVNLFGPDAQGQIAASLQAAGANVRHYDSNLNFFQLDASAATLSKLLAMDAVLYIEPLLEMHAMQPVSMSSIQADWFWGVYDPLPSGSTNFVRVGLCDTGSYINHDDLHYLINSTYGFSLISGESWNNDLNSHGTHVSGTILGHGTDNFWFRGVAADMPTHNDLNNEDFQVSQVLNQYGSGTGSDVNGIDSVIDGFYHMDGTGSGTVAGDKRDVFNMSLGANGSYLVGTDAYSRQADYDATDNVLPVIAAGNAGSSLGTIGTPGVAKNALTVGAINADDYGLDPISISTGATDTVTFYSSRGPTGDGRKKPDLLAPGSVITSTLAGTSNGYKDDEGTSMATPHVTGMAADLIGHMQYIFPPGAPTWAIKAQMLANAIDLGLPTTDQGQGKADAFLQHYAPDGGWYLWWWANGGTGSLNYVDVTLTQRVAQLKVVLNYPDPPAASGAGAALQNDLDLYVQTGALDTNPDGQWSDLNSNDTVSTVTINNAAPGTYRIKVYTYNQVSGSTQPLSVALRISNHATFPNVNFGLSMPYAIRPSTYFWSYGSATAGSYVASGVYGSINPGSFGLAYEALQRQSNPSSNTEWLYFANPWPGGSPWWNPYGMNQGDISAGYTRQIAWELQAPAAEGTYGATYAVRSSNGGSGSTTAYTIVDGTPPTLGPIASQNWGADLSPDVTCKAQDTLSGLNVGYVLYRYSTNGGSTWNGWYYATCTGFNGTTSQQTITATHVPFGQNNSAQNLIEFYITDMAGNYTYSAITGVSTPVPTGLTLTPSTQAGGLNVTGKVTLSGAAPTGGAQVILFNTTPAATVPSTVTVAAGATTATFTITTSIVSAKKTGVVTALYGGTSKSANLTVRPIGVKSLSLSPNPVVGGNNVTATVTLEEPAAPGNISVTLTSSNSTYANFGGAASKTITILAGNSTGTVTINTKHPAANTVVTIKATANSIAVSQKLTVTP